ncbi:MAG: Sec-independent protein translocase protein TatB [Caulobacteraceae bacterium]|nr:Sec-independent protein translocase protein TatB [Caulobacteraceae bacterium]
MFPEDRFVEILIIGALALIVIGPKDLPIMMRRIGQFVGRMRNMAAEFRASFDELARQSELDELRREVEALRTTQQAAATNINPMNEPHVKSAFEDINQGLSGVQFSPPSSGQIPSPAPIEAPAEAVSEPATPEPAPAPTKPVRKPRVKAASAKSSGKSSGKTAAKAGSAGEPS